MGTQHTQFDNSEWILLPSLSALQGTRAFLQEVLSARRESHGGEIPSLKARVGLAQ